MKPGVENRAAIVARAARIGQIAVERQPIGDTPGAADRGLERIGLARERLVAGEREDVGRAPRLRDVRARLEREPGRADTRQRNPEIELVVLVVFHVEAVPIEARPVARGPLQRQVGGLAHGLAECVDLTDDERPQDVVARIVRCRRLARWIDRIIGAIEGVRLLVAPVLVRHAEHRAELARIGIPAVAGEHAGDRIGVFGVLAVQPAQRAGQREPIEIERAAQIDVDRTDQPAGKLIGRLRLEDFDLLHQVRRDVGQRNAAAGGREYLAIVERGHEIRQSADQHQARVTARACDLHAGHALQRFRSTVVRQLADVLRDDGIDDLDRLLFDLLRALDAGAHARDDDFLDRFRRGRLLRDGNSHPHGDRDRGAQHQALLHDIPQ